jgi:hypothetical protein
MENMVGLGRLELPTLRLSGVRSNHLSYRPLCLGGCWRSRVRPSRKRNVGGECPAYRSLRLRVCSMTSRYEVRQKAGFDEGSSLERR